MKLLIYCFCALSFSLNAFYIHQAPHNDTHRLYPLKNAKKMHGPRISREDPSSFMKEVYQKKNLTILVVQSLKLFQIFLLNIN